MNRGDLFDLYLKEREYQIKTFGDYQCDTNLNVSSFLQFIEVTLSKAKLCYVEKWDSRVPAWLGYCKEGGANASAPIGTYEYLIKIFALAGAALEAYTEIDPTKWRESLEVKPKWNYKKMEEIKDE